MTHRYLLFVALPALLSVAVACRATPDAPAMSSTIDHDLLDVTVTQLQRLYAEKKYTVTQVVQSTRWRWQIVAKGFSKRRFRRYNP